MRTGIVFVFGFIFCLPLWSFAEEFPENSLFQLSSTWTRQDGKPMQLREFQGKPVILAMGYTSCEYACPIIVALMRSIEAGLSPEAAKQAQLVFVSFDTERDTPEVMKAYMEKNQLDASRWTFLHAASEDVLELAVLLDVKFKKDEKGGFSHSNVISVLDAEGVIVGKHVGLENKIPDTLKLIDGLPREKRSCH